MHFDAEAREPGFSWQALHARRRPSLPVSALQRGVLKLAGIAEPVFHDSTEDAPRRSLIVRASHAGLVQMSSELRHIKAVPRRFALFFSGAPRRIRRRRGTRMPGARLIGFASSHEAAWTAQKCVR